MENKQETAQALALDEMEKASGGVVWVSDQPAQSSEKVLTCPWCGQTFSYDEKRVYQDHIVRSCPNLPPAPTIIG